MSAMNYIQLARNLDKEAVNSGYPNFPDDVLSIIMDYGGANISQKPKNIYSIRFRYRHRRFTDNTIKVEDYNPYQKIMLKGRSRCGKVYYCDCCRKYFKNNPKTHDKGIRHINNDKPDLSTKEIQDNAFKWFKSKVKNYYGLDILDNPSNWAIHDIGFFKV